MRPRRASPDFAALCRRSLPTGLPSHGLLQIEHRAIAAHPLQRPYAIDLEGADAYVAGAKSANHDLLDGDLTGNIVFLAEALHQLQQSVGAAGEKRIRLVRLDQAFDNLFDILNRAAAIGICDRKSACAVVLEQRP